MRSTGVVCVALGVILLVFSGFPIVLGDTALQVRVGVGCAAFLAVPLVAVGIGLTRRAAARSGEAGEAEVSAAFARRASRVLEAMGGPPAGAPDPDGNPLDLNRVAVAGWLLALASYAFLLGEILLFRRLAGQGKPVGWAFVVAPLLAIGFFLVGRLFLKMWGVPLSKASGTPSRRRSRGRGAAPGEE